VPLPEGGWFAQPYRKKRRLTNRQSAEHEHWKQKIEGMYECGHREGVVVAVSPNGLVAIGSILLGLRTSDLFPRFVRIGDPCSYDDELLPLEPAEAVRWLTEIEMLREALEVEYPSELAGALVQGFFEEDLGVDSAIRQGLDQASGLGLSRTVPLEQGLPPRERVLAELADGMRLSRERILAQLANGTTLCQASLQTGNPIRFLW